MADPTSSISPSLQRGLFKKDSTLCGYLFTPQKKNALVYLTIGVVCWALAVAVVIANLYTPLPSTDLWLFPTYALLTPVGFIFFCAFIHFFPTPKKTESVWDVLNPPSSTVQ